MLQAYFIIPAVTGITENLFADIIWISILLILGTLVLFLKTFYSLESERVDYSNSDIPDRFIIPFNRNIKIEMKFMNNKGYICHPLLNICLRSIDFDRQEYYSIEAGSLDLPKLTLLSMNSDSVSNSIQLHLGFSSFYDIFYTHHSPDLVLSNQSAKENTQDEPPITLRSLFGKSLSEYYSQQIENFYKNDYLESSSLLPNPLGISGIVILSTDNASYILLRQRDKDQIAARGQVEWSFAGIVEASSWYHSPSIDFNEFVKDELINEVVKKAVYLRDPVVEPIGILFNPLYLYQPEIFICVKYKVSEANINSIKANFIVIDVKTFTEELKNYNLKNLVNPGLKLLRSADLNLFQ